MWPKEGGDVYLDILPSEKKPVDCLLWDGSDARARSISQADTIRFLTNSMNDFEFLKPVGKKQLIHTTPVPQKLPFWFRNVSLVLMVVLNLQNGMRVKKTSSVRCERYQLKSPLAPQMCVTE